MRAEHGNPVGARVRFGALGKPTARRAQLLGGNRMTEKRTPAAETRRENQDTTAASSRRWFWITGRIPGWCPDAKAG
jgi:hypothetical protein